MKYCPNCHAQLQDIDLFCGECGAEITAQESEHVENVFCSQCGQAIDAEDIVCSHCGAEVNGDEPDTEPVRKKGKGKLFLFGGLAAVLIAAIVATVFLLFGQKNTKYAAYLKDGELWFKSFSGDALEVTSKLLDTEEIPKEYLANFNNIPITSLLVQMSADGKTIFYPDQISEDGMNLYCRDVTDPESKPVKISADVTGYFINDKGDRIFYIKDKALYIGPLDQPQKVASDIGGLVALDEKFESVVYYESEKIEKVDDTKYEYTYYLWKDGKKEKIANGEVTDFWVMGRSADCKLNQLVDSIGGGRQTIYPSLSKFCYIKEDVLNVWTLDGNVEKIDSEVSAIAKVYENGDIYYLKENEDVKYVEYIEFETNMELTDYQKDNTLTTQNTLYRFLNGKKEVIAEDFGYGYYAPDQSVAIVYTYDIDSLKKVKMSETGTYWETCNTLRENLEKTKQYSIMVDGKLHEINLDDISQYFMTKDGSSIYFFCRDSVPEKDEQGKETGKEVKAKEGEIYLVTVEKGNVSAPKEYDSEVSGLTGLNRKGEPVYYKDYDEEKQKANLYIAQKEIDYDVLPGSVKTLENGAYVYFVDYNQDEDKKCGTVRISGKGETKTITDDVYSFVITPDDEILYLQDYDTEKKKGTLYRYNRGKNEQIDDDVTALLDIYIYDRDPIDTGMNYFPLYFSF